MKMRAFTAGCAVLSLAVAATSASARTPDREKIAKVVAERHDATVKALQNWIALPTIAAEKRNVRNPLRGSRSLVLQRRFIVGR